MWKEGVCDDFQQWNYSRCGKAQNEDAVHYKDEHQRGKACLVMSNVCEEPLSRIMSLLLPGRPNRNTWSSSALSVVSLGKSIHHHTSSLPLRIITFTVSSGCARENAPVPISMETSSGKSSHHSLFKAFTLKYHTITLTECTTTKQKWFQFG